MIGIKQITHYTATIKYMTIIYIYIHIYDTKLFWSYENKIKSTTNELIHDEFGPFINVVFCFIINSNDCFELSVLMFVHNILFQNYDTLMTVTRFRYICARW